MIIPISDADAKYYERKFWALIDTSGECWIFEGGKNRDGYGVFHYGGFVYRTMLAHRLAYELWVGFIPERLAVLHRCDTPACIRPKHLFLGTNADNSADCRAKGRTATGDRNGARLYPERLRRGTANPATRLTPEQVAILRARFTGRYGEQSAFAREFGVSRRTVMRVLEGETWAA